MTGKILVATNRRVASLNETKFLSTNSYITEEAGWLNRQERSTFQRTLIYSALRKSIGLEESRGNGLVLCFMYRKLTQDFSTRDDRCRNLHILRLQNTYGREYFASVSDKTTLKLEGN